MGVVVRHEFLLQSFESGGGSRTVVCQQNLGCVINAQVKLTTQEFQLSRLEHWPDGKNGPPGLTVGCVERPPCATDRLTIRMCRPVRGDRRTSVSVNVCCVVSASIVTVEALEEDGESSQMLRWY